MCSRYRERWADQEAQGRGMSVWPRQPAIGVTSSGRGWEGLGRGPVWARSVSGARGGTGDNSSVTCRVGLEPRRLELEETGRLGLRCIRGDVST